MITGDKLFSTNPFRVLTQTPIVRAPMPGRLSLDQGGEQSTQLAHASVSIDDADSADRGGEHVGQIERIVHSTGSAVGLHHSGGVLRNNRGDRVMVGAHHIGKRAQLPPVVVHPHPKPIGDPHIRFRLNLLTGDRICTRRRDLIPARLNMVSATEAIRRSVGSHEISRP